MAADFPREKWHRFEWGVTCQMLVSLLARDLQQLQAAKGFYHRAVAAYEKLTEEFPRDLLFRVRLADTHREWAFCLRDIGRTREAAEILDVVPNTVRAWGAAGKIPEYRHPINGYRLYKRGDLERVLRRLEQSVSTSSAPRKRNRSQERPRGR